MMDKDNSGSIDFGEYLYWCARKAHLRGRLAPAFRTIKDGCSSRSHTGTFSSRRYFPKSNKFERKAIQTWVESEEEHLKVAAPKVKPRLNPEQVRLQGLSDSELTLGSRKRAV